MADKRSYVAGNFTLELDGYNAGFIKSLDGGGIKADVINEPVGPDHVTRKHIGGVKYDDFNMSIGMGTSPPLQEWIKASWDHKYARKNGAVVQADFNYKEKFRREFFNALITEVGFPALDGSDKNPGYMTVKFSPEYTRNKKGSGSDIKGKFGGEQKMWLPANFEFIIDGMDTSHVNKVDAWTVKQTAVTDDIGSTRDYQKEPGKLEFPNLTFMCSEEFIEPWIKWHEDFVIKGNCTQDKEKTGSIKFLASNVDKGKPLLTIDLKGVGIMACNPDKMEANADTIKRWKVEIYVEEMAMKYDSGSTIK